MCKMPQSKLINLNEQNEKIMWRKENSKHKQANFGKAFEMHATGSVNQMIKRLRFIINDVVTGCKAENFLPK